MEKVASLEKFMKEPSPLADVAERENRDKQNLKIGIEYFGECNSIGQPYSFGTYMI